MHSDSRLKIEPLGNQHDRKSFSCGVEPLDRYLQRQSGQDVRRRLAACFVLVGSEDARVLGFYTLSATSVTMDQLPTSVTSRLPRYPQVPATLMGRLAVDLQHRGRRFGELLLFDAFARTLKNEIASFALVVDAKDAAAEDFYRRYHFLPLLVTGRRLYLPVAEIAHVLTRAVAP